MPALPEPPIRGSVLDVDPPWLDSRASLGLFGRGVLSSLSLPGTLPRVIGGMGESATLLADDALAVETPPDSLVATPGKAGPPNVAVESEWDPADNAISINQWTQ